MWTMSFYLGTEIEICSLYVYFTTLRIDEKRVVILSDCHSQSLASCYCDLWNGGFMDQCLTSSAMVIV